jgi:hypothetical protein
MRLLYGSAHSATSSLATQLYTSDTNTRAFSISIRNRTGNSGHVYYGTDSSVLAASGYQLIAGQRENFPSLSISANDIPASFKAHNAWISGASTSDVVDWVMAVET